MIYDPHPYQEVAHDHVIENKYCGLLLEMGLGKSIVTLTAFHKLKFIDWEINKCLIVAPKRVALHTWPAEIKKWDHLEKIKYSLIMGDTQARLKGLKAEADIYIINRENVPWLVSYLQSGWFFDMLVIDELSSFKSADANRFKALRMVRPKIKRVIGLTGSPAGNGLIDLWPEMYLLDMGERLGPTITGYRKTYFVPAKTNGHIVYTYKIKKQAEEVIFEKIGDICISMKSQDYLNMPQRITNDILVYLTPEQQKAYDEFEKESVLELLNSETEITALNAAALTGKLLQFANGAVYDAKKKWHLVHDAKMDELEEVIEAAQGQPVFIGYSFIHDAERILARFPQARKLQTNKDIDDWNAGLIPILITHPKSAGHGLNLQAGGHILIWFGLPWSLEEYDQFNARIDRQGQLVRVIENRLITAGTMDEDVAAALVLKANGQNALMDAIKARIRKYTHEALYTH